MVGIPNHRSQQKRWDRGTAHGCVDSTPPTVYQNLAHHGTRHRQWSGGAEIGRHRGLSATGSFLGKAVPSNRRHRSSLLKQEALDRTAGPQWLHQHGSPRNRKTPDPTVPPRWQDRGGTDVPHWALSAVNHDVTRLSTSPPREGNRLPPELRTRLRSALCLLGSCVCRVRRESSRHQRWLPGCCHVAAL